MSYLALYRRYRPTTFDNLIGQDYVVKTLKNQIISGKIGHAYLFTGTRGTGKTTVAKIFARAINCDSHINGSPCGKCLTCQALLDTSNIDVIEIDAASNNGVNEIRDLREKVQYPPVNGRYKVYIVDEVHMLTTAAFNALLKTLEEPPKHAVFILATTEVHKIPATILSRCMRFDFKLVPTREIADLIAKIYDEEGKSYDKEAIYAIASAGEGSVRDALSLADMAISFNSDKLTYNDVMEVLGSTNSVVFSEFIASIISGNSGRVFEIIDSLSTSGKSMSVLNKNVISCIRNLLIVKTCENANSILNIPEDSFNALNNVAKSVSEERLVRILGIFSEVETSLRYSTAPRIVFETAAIKASRPDSDFDLDALMSRIKLLEDKISNGNFFVKFSEVNQANKQDLPKINNNENVKNYKDFVNSDLCEIKGTLLVNLRNSGSELLWNILQNVEINKSGNMLSFVVQNEVDEELLNSERTKSEIYSALKDFGVFEIFVKSSSEKIEAEEIDKETENIRKLFGDDIVIINK